MKISSRETLSERSRPLRLRDTVAALDPAVLHAEAEESVRAILREGESANTRRSYASALRYWAAWFHLRYGRALSLPVPVPAVVQFLVDHVLRARGGGLASDLPAAIDAALVEGGYKGALGAPALATVTHRLSVLAKAHDLKELPNPVRDPAIRELVRRARRAYASRGVATTRKTAATREPLEAMLATCTDGMHGIRDRALLLFAWASGGRRRSEVAAAVMGNLVRVEEGYLYRLAHTKTDQSGMGSMPGAEKPLMGPAAAALTAWLEASGVTSGAIFRRIRGARAGKPLSAQAVALIVKRRAQLAGLEGDYGAHSLRSGFVTEAGRQGVPLGEAMALTGHRSVQTAMRYFQGGASQKMQAAHLLAPRGRR
jgi:integrase